VRLTILDRGTGWQAGRFQGLLQPVVQEDAAVWYSPHGFCCPVGLLSPTFGRFVRW
jgi:hypothetical protein